MTDFEQNLIRLCMNECIRVQGDKAASTQAVHIIAGVLASSIVTLMGGHEQGTTALAELLASELPGMAAKRAVSFRETFGNRQQTGRPH